MSVENKSGGQSRAKSKEVKTVKSKADDFTQDSAYHFHKLADQVDSQAARLGSLVTSEELEKMVAKLGSAQVPGRFLDRELSWLQFNERVLEQAEDSNLPLLERTWFASIFASNLDEFFMVRVAGIMRRIAAGMQQVKSSGLTYRGQIDGIRQRCHELMERHAEVFQQDLREQLKTQGIKFANWEHLSEAVQEKLTKFFKQQIFPVLTPLAVDPAHPFPYISGLSLNLAVLVRGTDNTKHFARVKVPGLLPRFIVIDADGNLYEPSELPDKNQGTAIFITLEEIIGAHLDLLFPGMKIVEYHAFRVTRNEDVELEEDDSENLLAAMEKEIRRRRFGPAVRLEVAQGISARVLDLLVRELGISYADVYYLPAPLDLTCLNYLHDLPRAELKFPPYLPITNPVLNSSEAGQPVDIFAALRHREVLLHHPYEAFSTSVQEFLRQAADDPAVLAIKQTLYRTSGDSPIIDYLMRAARQGKQVLAVVEIKARFDEEANIGWARKLERAGVHVVYGVVGLKTHCKLLMVVRREADGLRRYCHVGTGNYHPKTARGYEDFGLLTSKRQVGQDLGKLFNHLSGYSVSTDYERLLVSPHSTRKALLARIEQCTQAALAGQNARVKIKVNSVIDEKIIDALYRASNSGVKVDLWVRGICGLRPGIKGISENIRVRSILGRFLEHSRIYCFSISAPLDAAKSSFGDESCVTASRRETNNKRDTPDNIQVSGQKSREDFQDYREVWIGSADLMHRNLDRRVEALIQINDPEQANYLENLMDRAFCDLTCSWELGGNGWKRNKGTKDLQSTLIAEMQTRGNEKLLS